MLVPQASLLPYSTNWIVQILKSFVFSHVCKQIVIMFNHLIIFPSVVNSSRVEAESEMKTQVQVFQICTVKTVLEEMYSVTLYHSDIDLVL